MPAHVENRVLIIYESKPAVIKFVNLCNHRNIRNTDNKNKDTHKTSRSRFKIESIMLSGKN
jgi:hypothetical protein